MKVTTAGAASFTFLAQKGHFDGEGSRINFNFYHTCSSHVPTLRLSVDALVKKDQGAAVNAANAAIAKTQWQRFIDSTYNNSGQRQGWQGRC